MYVWHSMYTRTQRMGPVVFKNAVQVSELLHKRSLQSDGHISIFNSVTLLKGRFIFLVIGSLTPTAHRG